MDSSKVNTVSSPEGHCRDTIHMLWIGGTLSVLERLSMKSFLANGHPVILHAYGDVIGVPKDVQVEDARLVLPEACVFANSGCGIGAAGYAGFSDWFRYELLKREAGWWCDTDMVCLSHLSLQQDCVIATSREGQWGTPALGCALRLAPDDPLLDFCLDFCRSNNIPKLVGESYIAVGPGLIQRGIRELGREHYQVGPDIFCPISWRHTRFVVSPPFSRHLYNLKRRIRGGELVQNIKSETKAIHLWQSTWKLSNLDTDGIYPGASIYERLKAKYEVEP
jgi:hypothetical protein